jgi:hypothetical protein
MTGTISVKAGVKDRSLPAEIRSLTFTIQNNLDDFLRHATGRIQVVDIHSYSITFGLASQGEEVKWSNAV